MLMANRALTVINLVFDPDTGGDKAAETRLSGVSIFSKTAAAAGNSGLTAGCVCRCRIPAALCGGYTAPGAYTGTGWTLRPGDRLRLDTGEEVTILAVHDNRRGCCPHLYVEAS